MEYQVSKTPPIATPTERVDTVLQMWPSLAKMKNPRLIAELALAIADEAGAVPVNKAAMTRGILSPVEAMTLVVVGSQLAMQTLKLGLDAQFESMAVSSALAYFTSGEDPFGIIDDDEMRAKPRSTRGGDDA